MDYVQILEFLAMIIVTGGVTSGIFQLIKRYVPEKNNLRRICVWGLALVVALATSYLAGDVWGIIGSWEAGTITAVEMFTYTTGIWAVAEGLYRLWYKKAETPPEIEE